MRDVVCVQGQKAYGNPMYFLLIYTLKKSLLKKMMVGKHKALMGNVRKEELESIPGKG